VNISHNRLVGRLPASGVFQSLDASALEGNLGICSPRVTEPCRMNVPKPLVLDPNEYNNNAPGSGGGGVVPRERRVVLSVSAMVAISAAAVIVVAVAVITLLNMSARRQQRDNEAVSKESKQESAVVSSTSNKSGSSKLTAGGKVVTFGPGSSLRSEDLVGGADTLLSKATQIGRGVFGTVYRASTGQGRVVAVKKLASSGSAQPSRDDFDREVRVLGKARHPNLLPLKGYCWAPQTQLLITDYAPHGSLEKRLHHSPHGPPLTWAERFRVVSGTARGLAHLHHAFRPPMIHYGVKPSNVLLDEQCNPMVSDFGLARLQLRRDHKQHSRFQQMVSGGYVAPELACRSLRVNEKCDIYGFGVLVLELVTGRRAVEYGDDDVVVLIDQVRALLEHGNALDCVDTAMGGEFPEEEVLPVLKLGMVCTSQIPSNRPSMAEVVQILRVIKAPVG
jgi:hypothetical protein